MSETKFPVGTFVNHKLRPGFKMIVLSQVGFGMTFRPMVRVREMVNFDLKDRYYYPEELESTPNI